MELSGIGIYPMFAPCDKISTTQVRVGFDSTTWTFAAQRLEHSPIVLTKVPLGQFTFIYGGRLSVITTSVDSPTIPYGSSGIKNGIKLVLR